MATPFAHQQPTLTVAVDLGPLYGHRTGVAVAADNLQRGLAAAPGVRTLPYLLSARARPQPGHRRLPLPAAGALRLWARTDRARVDRWLRGADVIHGTNYVVPPSSLPRVVSVYDCWFLQHPELASPAVARAGMVLRRAAASGAYVHVSSAATAAVARELLGTDRVRVIHLGPPEAPDDLPTRPTAAAATPESVTDSVTDSVAPMILAIGTLEVRKDIPALIAAFGQLATDLPGARLVIAGSPGDDAARCAAAVAALPRHVADRVEITGPIDAARKATLMAAATVLAYPSRDEGFGFPILEAQRAGIAVVGRPSGSIPEVAGEGAELATDQSIDALVAALYRVLTDSEHRARLIAAGTANLSRFSWERCTAEMVQLYRDVTGRSVKMSES